MQEPMGSWIMIMIMINENDNDNNKDDNDDDDDDDDKDFISSISTKVALHLLMSNVKCQKANFPCCSQVV